MANNNSHLDSEGLRHVYEVVGKFVLGHSGGGSVFDFIETTALASGAIEQSSLSSGYKIVFHSASKKFLAKATATNKLHANWGVKRDGFGPFTKDGVDPILGKVYVERTTGGLYYWDGTDLRQIKISYANLSNTPTIPSDPSTASKTVKGIVSIGSGINVTSAGEISIELPATITAEEVETIAGEVFAKL